MELYEVADVIFAAAEKYEAELTDLQQRQLDEVLYSYNESQGLEWHFSREDALMMHRLVEMVKAGEYTEDMRL